MTTKIVALVDAFGNLARLLPCDVHICSWRHLLENPVFDLKEFRRIATRYDKTDCSQSAMINLAVMVLAIE